MSANVRFHSKYHSKNHHTTATPGYFDSGSDPMASATDPFKGDFYLDGSLSARKIISDSQFVNVLSAGGYATATKAVTGNYTILNTDFVIYAHGGASGSALLVPSASAVSNQEFIIKRTSETSVVTLCAQGSNKFENTYTTIDLTQFGAAVHIQSFGGNWFVIDPTGTAPGTIGGGGGGSSSTGANSLTFLRSNTADVVVNGLSGTLTLLNFPLSTSGLSAGTVLYLEGYGSISDPGTNGPNTTFTLKLNNTVIQTQVMATTSGNWHFKSLITVRVQGNSGQVTAAIAVALDTGLFWPYASTQTSVDLTGNIGINLTGAITNFTGGENVTCNQLLITRYN